MALLLVSVRSVAEADIAWAAGTDILDVKEPSRGSLGRADDGVLLAVSRRFAGRAALSAALGEAADDPPPAPAGFLGLGKLGVAGCDLPSLEQCVWRHSHRPRLVLTAYADWERAQAPRPQEVARLAGRAAVAGLLVDTWSKDGSRLGDWLREADLRLLRQETRQAGLFLALAGSLRLDDIPRLLPLEPDILGFRTAACGAAGRWGSLDQEAIVALARAVHANDRKSISRTLLSRLQTCPNHGSTSPAETQSGIVLPAGALHDFNSTR
jgi:uncharacterized protein (UPF0264 family)